MEPWAAIVIKVWSDHLVNLVVLRPDGMVAIEANTLIKQDPNAPMQDNIRKYAEWMPYQQGQAAKSEGLVKRIEELIRPAGAPSVEEANQDQSQPQGAAPQGLGSSEGEANTGK